MKIHVRVDSDAALRRFAALQARTGNLPPALDAIADDFLADERQVFAGREHWAPLDPQWAARKARQGFGVRTLVMTEGLEKSLTTSTSPYSVRKVSANELLIGTSNPVAHLHQQGTGRMPARPVVDVPYETRRRWDAILRDWLVGIPRGTGA